LTIRTPNLGTLGYNSIDAISLLAEQNLSIFYYVYSFAFTYFQLLTLKHSTYYD